MTLQEKYDLYSKYINTNVWLQTLFQDGTIRFIETNLKSLKILENSNMVIAYTQDLSYAVNVDILHINKDGNRIRIEEIEIPS